MCGCRHMVARTGVVLDRTDAGCVSALPPVRSSCAKSCRREPASLACPVLSSMTSRGRPAVSEIHPRDCSPAQISGNSADVAGLTRGAVL